jgi:hypothetical protein
VWHGPVHKEQIMPAHGEHPRSTGQLPWTVAGFGYHQSLTYCALRRSMGIGAW